MDYDALAGECITDECWEYIDGKYIAGKWTACDAMTTKYITGKRITDKCIAGITTTINVLLTSAESALLVSKLLAILGL